MGVPVVATDLPGVRYLLKASDAGILAPQDPDAFAAAVVRILTLHTGAPVPVAKFQWEAINKKVADGLLAQYTTVGEYVDQLP